MQICPKCNRFVREVTCPFCGATVDQRTPRSGPQVHASRVARAFGTVAVGASVAITACSSESSAPTSEPDGSVPERDASAPIYGTDAGRFPVDGGGVPVYGTDAGSVPVDGGSDAGSVPVDAGDSGPNDAGTDQ